MNDQNTLLQIDGVTKIFPGVRALDNVTFSVLAGEVHGLVGENGAGKSTLMAVASGALVPEQGRVVINGVETRGDTDEARRLGLAIVRQEPALMPDLTVAENLYLGVPEEQRPSLMRTSEWAYQLLRQWSDNVAIDASERVLSLNPEQRFIVEIVKALAAKPKVLVLDEPTEHLLAEDVDRLFERIRKVTASGCAVVYISHRIREVQKIANRLTVLRDGQGQGTYDAAGLSEQQIVELIVGGALDREFPAKAGNGRTSMVLDVVSLRGAGFTDVSLQVREGEIVGLAGIDGNGQREFMRALAGLARSRGSVNVNGKPAKLRNSQAAAASGIRCLPGDRHREGIFGDLSVRENFSIRSLPFDSIKGWISQRSEARRTRLALTGFAVKTPSVETPIRSLSGGNQQKLVLASVLASKPEVLLVDEPTQGVDVGARMEIYKVLRQAAATGTAVIVVSSDAMEVAGLCDRVLIFSRGHIVKELRDAAVSENNITSAVLTATTERERGSASIAGFWKWASGDWAPLVMLALAVCALGTVCNAYQRNLSVHAKPEWDVGTRGDAGHRRIWAASAYARRRYRPVCRSSNGLDGRYTVLLPERRGHFGASIVGMGHCVSRRYSSRAGELGTGRPLPAASNGCNAGDLHGFAGGFPSVTPRSGRTDRGFGSRNNWCAGRIHTDHRDCCRHSRRHA